MNKRKKKLKRRRKMRLRFKRSRKIRWYIPATPNDSIVGFPMINPALLRRIKKRLNTEKPLTGYQNAQYKLYLETKKNKPKFSESSNCWNSALLDSGTVESKKYSRLDELITDDMLSNLRKGITRLLAQNNLVRPKIDAANIKFSSLRKKKAKKRTVTG